MRVYYLKITPADCTTNGNSYLSPLIDLYQNSSYSNYSIVKSAYGSNALGTHVWTGLTAPVGGVTDGGIVSNGRYIDTTGRITIANYLTDNVYSPTASYVPIPALVIRSAAKSNFVYPDEFTTSAIYAQLQPINLTDANRYARFIITFSETVLPTWRLLIRIEIDTPVQTAMYLSTRTMLDKFPRWMAIRELNKAVDPATPSTPNSLGGALINSLAGEWVDDIRAGMAYLVDQLNIDTIDTNQKAWVYKSAVPDSFMYSVIGDGNHLGIAFDTREFYESLPNEHIAYWDESINTLYSNQQYTNLYINDVLTSQTFHKVWNYVDDMGARVALDRLKLESNENYIKRILDVFLNRGGVGRDEFRLALRRELNLWKYYATPATPDSNFLGATPTVLEMSDIESSPDYFTPDGLPTDKFIGLVNKLATQYPSTWGNFAYDNAMWDVGGQAYEGYNLVPAVYDATPINISDGSTPSGYDPQSGVGDGNDLYLYPPDAITGPHQFKARLRVKGRHKTIVQTSPTVTGSIRVYGTGDRKYYNNPPTTIWVSAEVTTFDNGNPIYVGSWQLTAKNNADVDKPNGDSNGYTTYDLFSSDDTTNPNIVFYNKSSGQILLNRIAAGNISKVTLHSGYWDPNLLSYTTKASSDTFAIWFNTNSSTNLTYNTDAAATPSYPTLSGLNGSPSYMPRAQVVMLSKGIAYSIGTWVSPIVNFPIAMNDTALNTATAHDIVSTPNIHWDYYLEATPNKKIHVEANSPFGSGMSQLTTVDADGNVIYLDLSYLNLNGSNAWSANAQIIDPSTPQLDFSIRNGANYPVNTTEWSYVEYVQQSHSFDGIVDENGPWQNGIPPVTGNTNFAFQTANLSRDDFGIPNTADYVINWIGIESLNPDNQLVLWVDSNVIESAVAEPYFLSYTYPANAVRETLVGGRYILSPFVLRAKLRAIATDEWNPQINAGWFFERESDYYLYSNPLTEQASPSNVTEFVLSDLARQGAPILIKSDEATPRRLREVSFFNESASPIKLNFSNNQIVSGTNSGQLFAAYPNIYNISVTDITAATPVITPQQATANVILTEPYVTDPSHSYQLHYRVRDSFYVDNQYEHIDNTQRTKVYFDTPASPNYYNITYETSILNPATPINVPLSPFYTTFNEGYLFISHDEYTLDSIEVSVSPSQILGDGQDYMMIALRSLDSYGNPKPNQTFSISTTFGTLDSSSITTNSDGFAAVKMIAGATPSSSSGTISITGAVSTSIGFNIETPVVRGNRLVATVANDQIVADGMSQNVIYGKVQDEDYAGVPNATVNWVKGRSIHDLFNSSTSNSPTSNGSVKTKVDGSFVVGPFMASDHNNPGYWFVSLSSSSSATPSTTYTEVGDVVFWNEYPSQTHGVEVMSGLPTPPIQMATPPALFHYTPVVAFPVSMTDTDPAPAATPTPVAPGVINTPTGSYHLPPWYAITQQLLLEMGAIQPIVYDPVNGLPIRIGAAVTRVIPNPSYRDY